MYIYHGSDRIIKSPVYGQGSKANDFGRGFYCTENLELAKEWACKKNTDGFANKYILQTENLHILNLQEERFHILNWLALLTKFRGYWQAGNISEDAKIFLQEHYLIDIEGYDIIIGYRADDSYFSFAQDFISGTISLQTLSRAMKLGKFGEQIVLKSEKAFSDITYIGNEIALSEEYFTRKHMRDLDARRRYAREKHSDLRTDIYMIDIMRGRVTEDELRL